MSSENSTLGNVAKFFKGVASILIGVPTALVASIVVGTAFLMVESMNICYSHVRKGLLGEKKIVFEPALNDAANFLKSAFIGVWTKWGIYGYKQAAQYGVKFANTVIADAGLHRPFNELDDRAPSANAAKPEKAMEMAQKEIANFFKPDDKASTQSQQQSQENALSNLSAQGFTAPPQTQQNQGQAPSQAANAPSPSPSSPSGSAGPAVSLDDKKKKGKKRG